VVATRRKDPMDQSQLDLNALTVAVSKGIIDGTANVVAGFATAAEKRHAMQNDLQDSTHKVYELDGEIKLLKGMMISLMGNGDGSSGVVPRLEKDMSTLGTDMASVKAEMREVRSDISSMKDDVKAIRDAQIKQENWSAGVKGGTSVGRWLIGMAVTVISGIISIVVYLFAHGLKP